MLFDFHGAYANHLLDEVMEMIGRELGRMHKVDIVHGDLTTSNMMLRRVSSIGVPELVGWGVLLLYVVP